MRKKIKLVFWFLITNILLINTGTCLAREVGDATIFTGLDNTTLTDSIIENMETDGTSVLSSVLIWIKDSLSSLVLIIAIAVFLYIGAKLAIARGNPEEFKKALMQLVYTIIGIFIVGLAWALVNLVAGINL